jgi:hypothetical protein
MSDKTLSQTVTLCIGDPFHDGHNMTETIAIKCNRNKEKIKSAYKVGSKKINLDLVENIAKNYEDSSISLEDWKKLESSGLKVEDCQFFTKEDFLEEEVLLKIETFTYIYLFIVQQGDLDFKYEVLETDESPTINIGGYGLFS